MSAKIEVTEAEREQAYADRIAQLTPSVAPDRAPGQRPQVILLGGQPAAGKSTTQRLLHASIGADRMATYESDDNAAVHPRYDAIMREHGMAGHDLAWESLEGLHPASLAHLRAGDPQYDVLASHPLTREEWAKEWVSGFTDQGYRASVVYIATHEANSSLGLTDRYQAGVDDVGYGRWLPPELHDEFYQEMPATAQVLESAGLVDDIYVVDRDGYVLYENHRGADGQWEHEPGVGQAIKDERDRPPTPEARAAFDRTADRLLAGRDPALPPLEDRAREVVEEAVRREHARPAPQPNGRGLGTAVRIDERLQFGDPPGQSGQVPQPGQGAQAGQVAVQADALQAQRLAASGIAPAGSGAGSSVGTQAAGSQGRSGRETGQAPER